MTLGEKTITHNLNWWYILNHRYKILIIGGLGSGKTNILLNLINHQLDIDKMYLQAKHPLKAKSNANV